MSDINSMLDVVSGFAACAALALLGFAIRAIWQRHKDRQKESAQMQRRRIAARFVEQDRRGEQ